MQILDNHLPLWGVCEHEGACVIAAAFPYRLPEAYYQNRNVSRYAVVPDYHKICGARLAQACACLQEQFPAAAFQWQCDSGSLPEVELARRAGLGVRGKHNLFITEPYGSWVFLGFIITNANVRPPAARASSPHPCAACAAPCAAACPTGALSGPFNRDRCLSAISQRKGALTPEESALLRQTGTAWGCDLCQEACPRNQASQIAPLPEFLADPIAHVTLETPMENRAFAWGGKSVLRRNLECCSLID